MSRIELLSQDWELVVIRKRAPNAVAKKDEKAVNVARRSGAEIETVKKSTAGTNKAASSSTTLNTRKLDEETENLAPMSRRPGDATAIYAYLQKKARKELDWKKMIYREGFMEMKRSYQRAA